MKARNVYMTKTKKETMDCKTTITRSADQKSVYEFTREYGFDGKKALVITLSSESNNSTTYVDRTKYFTFINMTQLGYSKITLFNLFTRVDEKLKPTSYTKEEMTDSFKYLKKLLEQGYDAIVIAVGTTMSKNRRVKECKKMMYELLLPYHKEGKVMRIVDNLELYKHDDEQCLHPLYAGNYIGGRWKLIPYDIEMMIKKLTDELKPIEPQKPVQAKKESPKEEGK